MTRSMSTLKTIFHKDDVENQIKRKFEEFCLTLQLKNVGQNSGNWHLIFTHQPYTKWSLTEIKY